ncbi:FAD-dependent oxidoreductase [Planctomycetota bacterium]
MASSIREPERRLPVNGDFDITVVGGGIAGVSAAVAAARDGASVCLIEKENALGGLATLANIVVYLPLCDGLGRKVTGGLGEELLRLSVREEPDRLPPGWRHGSRHKARRQQRYRVLFNPASLILALEELVLKNGITLMYDTRFCDVRLSRKRITHIIIENKSGRSAIKTQYAVDASGDADVCAAAGEPTVSLDTNVTAAWYYTADGENLKLHSLSDPFNANPESVPSRVRKTFAGDQAEGVTAMLISQRGMVRKHLRRLRKEQPDRAINPVCLPNFPSFRMTRRHKGVFELTEAQDREFFEDTIGMIGHWRKKGPVFCLPFRSLTAVRTANLLTAGRCISVDNSACDITRVIPACAVSGQAAGMAAALALQSGRSLKNLDIPVLQKRLKERKVIIDPRRLHHSVTEEDPEAGEAH